MAISRLWQSWSFNINNLYKLYFSPHIEGLVPGHCLHFTFQWHMILLSLYMMVTDIFDRLTMFLPVSYTSQGSGAFRIKRRH